MLQRIQSVLLLMAILSNLATFFIPIWKYAEGTNTEFVSGMGVTAMTEGASQAMMQRFTENPFHIGFFVLAVGVTAFIGFVIFQYADRRRQMRLANIAIIGLMLEILAIVLVTTKGPFMISSQGASSTAVYGFALPVLAILFVWYARMRIKKDDELVRSVDRIR